jgi:hypothetical protein
MIQFCGDIYCAAELSKCAESINSSGDRFERYASLLGNIKHLCAHFWPQDIRAHILHSMEKMILRILTNLHPATSFSSLLVTQMSSYSEGGDIELRNLLRCCPVFWRFYLTLESIHILNSVNRIENPISHRLFCEDVEKRLTLFFRGTEIYNGAEEIVAGQNISILQGSLRSKSIWMEPFLGDILLLHLRLERLKRKHQDESGETNEEIVRQGEEEYVMKSLLDAMEKREFTPRIISSIS